MSMQPIVESGMTFGPYPEGHCFYIEKSETYKKVQEGMRMAEFLLLCLKADMPAQVWVIEAKSSSPQPETSPNFDEHIDEILKPETTSRFAEYIDEIQEKLTNGLRLGLASFLKRHESAENELSQEFKNLDLATCGFRLVLVINGHKEDWLPPLQEALKASLRLTVKTWALGTNSVAVLNEEGARKYGLIL